MLFYAKMGILGKYLYVSDTLFILYLEGNHTLFGDKLYFIWKFSSGNTGQCGHGVVSLICGKPEAYYQPIGLRN